MNCQTINNGHDTHVLEECATKGRGHLHPTKDPQAYRAPVDVYESTDEYILIADMPGTAPDDIEIVIDGTSLEITGTVQDRYATLGRAIRQEYGVGDYHRHIRIGKGVNADGITAVYREGILRVNLPRQAESTPRTVQVKEDRS